MKLVETIRIENGRVRNIKYHNARFNKSRETLFCITKALNLRDYIKLGHEHKSGLFKCRIIYGNQIERIEIVSSEPREINSFKIIEAGNEITYDHKYVKRAGLDALLDTKEGADEIIILQNSFVTDAYYFNLVFEKNGVFVTPRQPLLHGTMRAYLLKKGRVVLGDITKEDIYSFERVHFVNALNPLGKITVDLALTISF